MDMANRLKTARMDAGFERAADAARALGIPEPTYMGHENGMRGIRMNKAVIYARRFKVPIEWLLTGKESSKSTVVGPFPVEGAIPVIGKVAAGVWTETDVYQDDPTDFIPYMPNLKHPIECYFGLVVDGRSMDKKFADGATLLCLDIAASGISINDRDIAIVERIKHQDGIREVTAKRVRKKGKTLELWPESTLPQFQKPLIINGSNDDEGIFIKARVVGVYTSL